LAFNSIEYLWFLLIVVLLYRFLPFKVGLVALCGASYYFYACWNHIYLILIIASTLIDYGCAQAIEKNSKRNRLYLGISLLSNLGLLFIFKYFGFFTQISSQIAELLGGSLSFPTLQVLLPVGISFYTFQTMSYTIDVYRGNIKAEKNLLRFALYVAFFPQLVAGPIERAGKILPQFFEKKPVTYELLASGAKLITWGLFKKVVIADRLSTYVQWVFDQPENYSNGALAMAGFFANILIYADFSAYADIAIGSAKCLGIKLSPNFHFPLFSIHMPDFWRRWHISLHNWFLDYVYYPAGGSRVGYFKFIFNVFLIFMLSGLWHGAAWNFVIWSLFHFTLVIFHIHILKFMKWKNWNWKPNFFFLTLGIILVHIQRDLSMYLFFIPDVQKSFDIYTGFFTEPWNISRDILGPSHLMGFLLSVFFTGFLLTVEFLHLRKPWVLRFSNMSLFRRYICYYFILFSIFIFGIESDNPFIYFQF
jgi:D-alanyl-lipoteichoic acid acyltransferase DltB (MBOAT superfamily)